MELIVHDVYHTCAVGLLTVIWFGGLTSSHVKCACERIVCSSVSDLAVHTEGHGGFLTYCC